MALHRLEALRDYAGIRHSSGRRRRQPPTRTTRRRPRLRSLGEDAAEVGCRGRLQWYGRP
jgi:ribosomal protein S13